MKQCWCWYLTCWFREMLIPCKLELEIAILKRAHARMICFQKTQESPAKMNLYERLASQSGKGKAYV